VGRDKITPLSGGSKMKLSPMFETIVGLALLLALVVVSNATAQTVISNETLVTTTFVVNKKIAQAYCFKSPCQAQAPMFAAIPVVCPAATGHTCTFHISLDAQIYWLLGTRNSYRFLIDGAAPTIGPTDQHGVYVFQRKGELNVPDVQSCLASVVTTVTNSSSNTHKIKVDLGCSTFNSSECQTAAHSSTMRVDVFEP
jgi:hypothetical protein